MQEKDICLAEGVTLSGADLQRLHTDSAPEKSGLQCKPKDAEGVRLIFELISQAKGRR